MAAEKEKEEKPRNANVMRRIVIDKLIVNCNVGESGDKLTKAAKVLTQ